MTPSTQVSLPATWEAMAGRIDYAQLRIDTQERDLRLLCLEAEKFRIPAVVVNPVNVALAARFARGTGVKVAAAVSYPVGAYWPEDKALEVQDAVEDGADEIYMLMAVGAFLNGWVEKYTIPEMKALVRAAHGRPTRLITEASVLTEGQRRTVCELAIEAGIDALVACTSFLPSKLPPITLGDVEVLAGMAGDRMGIIYMGPIESTAHALDFLKAGASRLCTESARTILGGFDGFPGQP
jgi:deoxyribose-phosphate aldolase